MMAEIARFASEAVLSLMVGVVLILLGAASFPRSSSFASEPIKSTLRLIVFGLVCYTVGRFVLEASSVSVIIGG